MNEEPQWKKDLEHAQAVTARMLAEHADVAKEHEEWLRDHTRAMAAHNRAMEKHNLAIARHDEQMEEIRTELKNLTKRLGGGGNGHGQV